MLEEAIFLPRNEFDYERTTLKGFPAFDPGRDQERRKTTKIFVAIMQLVQITCSRFR